MPQGPVDVRKAMAEDVDAMVALIEARRLEYQAYAPVFWNKAEKSAEMSRVYFTALASSSAHTVLVALVNQLVVGFMIAFQTPVPPVFKPGPGPTVLVDDFYLAAPELWPTVGHALFAELQRHAREAGWSQLVVVTAHKDLPKTAFLADQGLLLTSEWWTLPITGT